MDDSDKKYDVISLFTGIGGMDSGFGGNVSVPRAAISEESFISKHVENNFVELKPTNFNIVFQNDVDKGVEHVLDLNRTNHNFSNVSIYDLIQNGHEFPQADVVIGGFPCQSFSHAGKRLGFENTKSHNGKDECTPENNSGNLYKCFVEVCRKVKPKIFVAENVQGLLTIPNAIDQIMSDFADVGYVVQYQLVDCSEFGVAQTRKRVFIIGIRTDYTGALDQHWNHIEKNRGHCVVSEYFKHLAEPEISDDICQQLYSKAKRLSKGQGQSAIAIDGFAPTIRANHHGNIEFRRLFQDCRIECLGYPRRLTVRECGLIQSFHPNFKFTDKSMSNAYKWIGNAVPPLIAYVIADKVNEILKKHF